MDTTKGGLLRGGLILRNGGGGAHTEGWVHNSGVGSHSVVGSHSGVGSHSVVGSHSGVGSHSVVGSHSGVGLYLVWLFEVLCLLYLLEVDELLQEVELLGRKGSRGLQTHAQSHCGKKGASCH